MCQHPCGTLSTPCRVHAPMNWGCSELYAAPNYTLIFHVRSRSWMSTCELSMSFSFFTFCAPPPLSLSLSLTLPRSLSSPLSFYLSLSDSQDPSQTTSNPDILITKPTISVNLFLSIAGPNHLYGNPQSLCVLVCKGNNGGCQPGIVLASCFL